MRQVPKKPKKPKKVSLAKRSQMPEAPDTAGPERDLCQQCGAWREARTPFMPAWVPPDWTGRLLVVGERPGQDEDRRTGRPFTGPAGRVLAELLREAGYTERDVAYTNAVRCGHPNNTEPTMVQVRCCRSLLLGLIDKLNPQVVLGVGTWAARALTNSGRATVTSLRGREVSLARQVEV